MGLAGSIVVLALALAGPALAGWEQNQCVKCHEAEVLPVTLGHSFADWSASVHAKGGVGCEKCHGGDPGATTFAAAHKDVLPAADPSSRVYPTHLPETCGACHPKELAAFDGTVHAKQLKKESGEGATCFTCHEAMATSLPTPRELSARCAVCHKKPIEAQAALVVLVSSKTQLYRTRKAVEAVKAVNPSWYEGAIGRFHDLERDYGRIQVRWHTFATRDVLRDSNDLLKLSHALAEEADVKMRHAPEP
jgi:hypothetical protein